MAEFLADPLPKGCSDFPGRELFSVAEFLASPLPKGCPSFPGRELSSVAEFLVSPLPKGCSGFPGRELSSVAEFLPIGFPEGRLYLVTTESFYVGLIKSSRSPLVFLSSLKFLFTPLLIVIKHVFFSVG